MVLARSLDGVISGEHGIGLTKYQYLDQKEADEFAQYKQQIDPNGHFNKGKLLPGSGLQNAYTPSLRLVEREALLLEHNELGELNKSIKDCLRCGKCKPVCNTHIPRANLLYSPRNKILATGLMIEAFLYEAQTQRGVSLRHFDEMNDVADHCTVCHKCFEPCPVNIDFGDVTIKMRSILKTQGQRRVSPVAWAGMQFLNIKDANKVEWMRAGMVGLGFKAQNLAYQVAKKTHLISDSKRPEATTGKPSIKTQVIQFVKKPLPAGLPAKTTRAMLGLEDNQTIPIIRDPVKTANGQGDAVFYFPGCGSERLFSQVGLATIAMLYEVGATTVLPPGYLCCGYPQASAGDTKKGNAITTENRVLFHRVANTLKYLNIKTVIVSCGTCMDQLMKYEFERIFPECRLLDIHEYLLEKGMKMEGVSGIQYVYHDPCHTPMKQINPMKVVTELTGSKVVLSERCCGEAGTFAVNRPDIASQVRFRKEESLKEGIKALTGETEAKNGNVKILTSCPACQQGLSRYRDDTGMDTDYIVVEMANHLLGKHWQKAFVEKATHGGIEKVLL
jgi:Fe-S oxidoreductase